MKWLVLGGTKFLGRTFVEEALAAGHEVTLFNRGKTGPTLFPDVETITGDRTNPDDLAKLAGRQWDAVFDPSAYVPRIVEMSAKQLAGAVGHYVFVSSISVYKDHATPQIAEDYPVGVIDNPETEEITGESYGPLKALCEQRVEAIFPNRALMVRAGLIVGPYDPTDRFTYWPTRIVKGGPFVAPVGPSQGMQFIDARDIAQWVLAMVAAGKAGTYNVTGDSTTMGEVFACAKAVSGSDAQPVYMDAGFLTENGAIPWQEIPLWIPAEDEHFRHMHEASIAKAKADGLTFRPLETTIRDLLAWDATRDHTQPPAFGLPAEKEQMLLETWRLR